MKKEHSVIKKMQLTEKAAALTEKGNTYFFEVDRDANKHEVKAAVEALFSVSVKGVRTMNCIGKKKRVRTARYGKQPDWKRAVVTLDEGSKIDLT